jgi:hypothetical protein
MFGRDGQPRNVHEEFLLQDLDTMVDHNRVVALVVYRWRSGLAAVNKKIKHQERHVKRLGVPALIHWRNTKQPGKDAVFAFAEAEIMKQADPTLIAAQDYLDVLLAEREDILAYLKALEVKLSTTPGMQGMYNRLCADKYDGE